MYVIFTVKKLLCGMSYIYYTHNNFDPFLVSSFDGGIQAQLLWASLSVLVETVIVNKSKI